MPSVSTAANGQPSDFAFEEIIVTAQKRSESIQTVPISVSAISGSKIAEAQIARIEDLSLLVPNFSVYDDPIGDKINIRGIQSGNNAGLEQSVSTYVDGVYRGRGVQSRFAFLDIERVEVLRGPQGTLFGKNTIGGAVNISTARPTYEFEGALNASYIIENIDEYEVRGYVSGPLAEGLRFRTAIQYRDLSEGLLENDFYGTSTPALEEFAGRLTLEWDAGENTMVTARLEAGDFDLNGQPFGIREAGPLALFGVEENNFRRTNIGSRNAVLDIGSSGNHEGDSLEASVTVKHTFAKGELTTIAAYSNYDFERQLDADFSPLDLARFDDREDFEQTSFEVRYASELDGPFQYLVGAYFQDSDLTAEGDTFFNVRGTEGEVAIDTLLSAGCALTGGDPLDRNCILSSLISAFDGTPLAYTNLSRLHALNQSSKVYAVFGQVSWDFSDELTAIVGMRYSHERKKAQQSAFSADFNTLELNPLLGNDALYAQFGAPSPFAAIAEAENHSNNLARSEDAFTWSATVQWQASEDTMYYAKVATGFKAGGFNSFALSADPAEAEYEEEEAIGFEIGSKTTLLDGRLQLNFAGFYTDFSDLQTALFTGSTSFIVQNASSATSKGIEFDGRLAITDNLRVTAAAAYVDFEFDSFPNAGCTAEQLFDFRSRFGGPLATIQDCSAAGFNDLTGRTSENTPEFSGALSLTHDAAIGADYILTSTVDIIYQGAQFRQADLDPFLRDNAYTKVNLVSTFGPNDDTWTLSLAVKNLFNVRSFNYGNDAPLLEGTRLFIPDRPRTIALSAGIRF